jgi:DNA-binding transcriptional regulator YhcF (GntR family)
MEPFERIKPDSEIPKYRQVCDLIIRDIESGIFKQGQRIPSINETSEELLLSRDTVERAYISLKKKGILMAVKGKGYFVNQTSIYKKLRVALVFNKLSNYKRSIYYSLAGSLGAKASVDVFIYNYSLAEFESIIENNITNYDFFVILPHFSDENADYQDVIRKIPREKVIIADRFPENLQEYPVVYQEFENDIQSALTQALTLLGKYSVINLVFPADQFYSKRIARGFQIFCQVNGFPYTVIDHLSTEHIRELEAYVVVSDDDLYSFIKLIREKGWRLGSQIGVVAYNDNPVKEILEDGITTISTNHDMIGRLIAQMILTRDFRQIRIPFRFIERKSL